MKRTEPLMTYEDVDTGDEFLSPSRTVGESDVFQFAGITGDFNELHTSEAFAESTPYGTRIVHGMLTLAIANGLYVRIGIFKNSVFLGIDRWRFLKPVKIGDTICLRLLSEDKRETKDGKRGIIGMKYEVLNQKDEIVADGVLRRMVDKRGTQE